MSTAWTTPLPAASVILLRDSAAGPEIFLLRRHTRSEFMADQYVFPGGKVDDEDGGDPRVTAIRELFEEGGVLLARGVPPADPGEWRRRLAARTATFADLLRAGALTPDVEALRLWGRWVTPSDQKSRFDARFYVGVLPVGQGYSHDARETTAEAWLTARAALDGHAAGTLALPPPQLHTLDRIASAGHRDCAAFMAALDGGAHRDAPLLPRAAHGVTPRLLMFPWDPQYATHGEGEALAMPAGAALARGPSRVQTDGTFWRFVSPP